MMNSVSELKEQLLQSHWPKCDQYAHALAEMGDGAAKHALLGALKAKRHHIRTSVIKALLTFQDLDVVPHIELLLADSSYETRMEAKAAILALTGRAVKTARGE